MKRLLAPVLLGSAALAACSGGDGGILPGDRQPPPAGAAITTANAPTVVGTTWNAANRSASLTGLLTSTGFVASEQDVASSETAAAPSKLIDEYIAHVPFSQGPDDCVVSGTVTVTGDIADPITPTLTAGDVLQVILDNCDDGVGEVVNGTLDYVVDAFSGDLGGGMYVLTMSVVVTDYSVTSASGTITAAGDATVTLDTSAANMIFASVTGSSMTSTTPAATETLSNYQSAQSVDLNVDPSEFTFSSLGTIDSSELVGVVSYTTPVTFMGFGVEFPSSGELLINGTNSSARLIAVDNTNVRIEIDSDGDGTVDDSIDTTWAALTSGT